MFVRLRLITLGVALLLMGGGALWMYEQGPRPHQRAVIPSRRDAATGIVSATGVVEPISGIVHLTFSIPGTLASLSVAEGQAVRQGQVVAQLAADDLDARIAVAQQDLAAREAILSGLPPSPNDTARQQALTDVAQARLRLIDAQQAAEKAVLRAPIDGVVLSTPLHPGEWTEPGSRVPVLTVADLSRLQVRAEVDVRDATTLAVGQKAVCRSEDFGPRPVPAVVHVVGQRLTTSPDAENASNSPPRHVVPVLLLLDGHPHLPIGLRVDVAIQTVPPTAPQTRKP